MEEIEDWLRSHGDELTEIGRHTHVAPGMMHLLAVLVLGGVADGEIIAEIEAHVAARVGPDPLVGVPLAVREIRALAAAS